MDDATRADRARLERLERRVLELEWRLGLAPVPSRAPPSGALPPAPAAGAARPAPVSPSHVAVVVPAPSVAQPRPASRPAVPLRERVDAMAPRLLAWAGGLALVVGVAFFLSLAFSRGWIGPEGRVLLGLAGGATAIGLGASLLRGSRAVVGHALVASGLAAISLACFAATRLYALVPPEVGLAAVLATAVAAAVIAVRAESQLVAAEGLLAVLAAPPVLGAGGTPLTLAFVGAILVGTTLISVARAWRWLPPLAFLLSAPQLLRWALDDAPLEQALAVAAVYWGVTLVAAIGHGIVSRGRREVGTAAALVLANSAVWVLIVVARLLPLDAVAAGVGVAILAAAHLAVAAVLFRALGRDSIFALLVAGTGAASIALAVALALDGPPTPIAWTAEAAALAWIAGRERHRWSAAAALVLACLAAGHLLAVEYPLWGGVAAAAPAGRGIALVAGLAALAFVALLPGARPFRPPLAGAAIVLLGWAAASELPRVAGTLDGLPVITAWAALGLAGIAIGATRLVPDARGATAPLQARRIAAVLTSLADAPVAIGLVLFGLAALATASLPRGADPLEPPAVPFGSIPGVATLIVLAAAVLAAALAQLGPRRSILAGAATLLALAAPAQLPLAWAVVVWTGLATAVLAYARDDPHVTPAAVGGAAGFVLLSAVGAAEVLGPDRLAVRPRAVHLAPFFTDATVALAALAAGAAAVSRALRHPLARVIGGGIAGAIGVLAISVGVVDAFSLAAREPGANVVELAKASQVALSLVWTGLGFGLLAAGVALRRLEVRLAGLALLAVASIKVFLVDLAALDVAYRVLSFLALGVLLLAAAYVSLRFRPLGGPPADAVDPGGGA